MALHPVGTVVTYNWFGRADYQVTGKIIKYYGGATGTDYVTIERTDGVRELRTSKTCDLAEWLVSAVTETVVEPLSVSELLERAQRCVARTDNATYYVADEMARAISYAQRANAIATDIRDIAALDALIRYADAMRALVQHAEAIGTRTA